MLQSKGINLPDDALVENFVTIVVPTIWGHNLVENIQLKSCRQTFDVGSHTPTIAVLDECGGFPLLSNTM